MNASGLTSKVKAVLELCCFLSSVRTVATGHILRHGDFKALSLGSISCIWWMEWGFKPLLRLELPHYDLLSLHTAANSCFLSISLYLFLLRFLSLCEWFLCSAKTCGGVQRGFKCNDPPPPFFSFFFLGESQRSFLQASDDDRAALSLAVPTAGCRLRAAHSPRCWHAREREGGVPLQQTLSFPGRPTGPPRLESLLVFNFWLTQWWPSFRKKSRVSDTR